MNLSETLAVLRSRRMELARLGVSHLALYGSMARDQADAESDVDVIVDSHDGRALGLFGLARIADTLETMLRRRVDVISRAGLERASGFKSRIAADLIDVF